jgi:DNA-binding NarL/FixJ family response regulator
VAPKSQSKRAGRARLLLVDDHPLVREWLAALVARESDLQVCGQAEEAAAALALVSELRPDLAIVDLTLPRGSGLELIKDLRSRHPAVRILVLTSHDEAEVAERAFRAGAHGFAIKRDSGPRVVEAIRSVLAGRFYASPALAAQLAGRMFAGTRHDGSPPDELLSDREMEVFRRRGQGRRAKEIAAEMGISVKTVGSYEARIKEKLGLEGVGDLVREAVLWNDRRRRL